MAATRTAVESNINAPDSKLGAADTSETSATKTEREDSKTTNAPLAPPPKPSQSNGSGPDYFSGSNAGASASKNSNNGANASNNSTTNNSNGQGSHFSLEPNPFEQSFGNPSSETPKQFGGLPSVASLTSPAPLGPGGTPNWQGSLRSGPLSPAMLTGPTGGNGYFDSEFRGSFPTPNESSLRTGLTPGGGGSMFPAPSPNSQAIFNSLQNGGATPGTLDFHRTAMNAAAARSKDGPATTGPGAASSNGATAKAEYQQATQQPAQSHQDPFTNQPESDAVNSLYMLANTGNRNANQFAVPNQPQQGGGAAQMQQRGGAQGMQNRNAKGQSVGSLSGSGMGEHSDEEKPSMRNSKKKGSAAKPGKSARKAEDTPSKQPNSKRAKNSMPDDDDSDDDDDMDMDMADMGGNGSKKMTDEEKRKNFLERNRVAALKCRQRKKQWLANLQTKVEIFTSENDALSAQCTQLREEVVHLKTLLLAHKDCPVSHQQGLGGNAMAQVMGDFNPHNPYGMMPNGQMQMGMQQGQGMQRR